MYLIIGLEPRCPLTFIHKDHSSSHHGSARIFRHVLTALTVHLGSKLYADAFGASAGCGMYVMHSPYLEPAAEWWGKPTAMN